ncbi:MAG TPA: hypothetical protein VJT09_15320 [Pyrinomonadaceae bacterium]|nr:hypothetical protein [Pyrinomonadaceae bacterium]
MADEDRRVSKLEWSVADVQQAIKLLTQLALKAEANQEAGVKELAEAQAASEHKIAALADAQLRTEEALVRLSKAVESLAAAAHSRAAHLDD